MCSCVWVVVEDCLWVWWRIESFEVGSNVCRCRTQSGDDLCIYMKKVTHSGHKMALSHFQGGHLGNIFSRSKTSYQPDKIGIFYFVCCINNVSQWYIVANCTGRTALQWNCTWFMRMNSRPASVLSLFMPPFVHKQAELTFQKVWCTPMQSYHLLCSTCSKTSKTTSPCGIPHIW
jgi:hypothetical protein